ncbi:hypothetical protein PAHAL_9G374300 [Panicum hallii]|uniref:Uncharacterized protein n=1 Tax=Panicum hallii TaxID=206008 RepID=A0A2T8I3T2_9POAL|nr:hypothetical protein PAHAL_9G374300 [Panicum hallii]
MCLPPLGQCCQEYHLHLVVASFLTRRRWAILICAFLLCCFARPRDGSYIGAAKLL